MERNLLPVVLWQEEVRGVAERVDTLTLCDSTAQVLALARTCGQRGFQVQAAREHSEAAGRRLMLPDMFLLYSLLASS